MFTGLVEEVGLIAGLKKSSRGYQLVVEAEKLAPTLKEGDSVAVNGVCLTVVKLKKERVYFNVLEETLRLTNMHRFRRGKMANLERALTATRPLGGHFMQGHVDCTSELLAYEADGLDHRLEVALPPEFAQYVCYKGSIAVNGVSLTVARVEEDRMIIWIVSHTHKNTNFNTLRIGTLVNLEFDILAKYVERMLVTRGVIEPNRSVRPAADSPSAARVEEDEDEDDTGFDPEFDSDLDDEQEENAR